MVPPTVPHSQCPLQCWQCMGQSWGEMLEGLETPAEPSLQCQQHTRITLGQGSPHLLSLWLPHHLAVTTAPLLRMSFYSLFFIPSCVSSTGGGSRRLLTGQLSRLGRGWPAPPLLLSSQGSPCCSCASLSRPLIIWCYLKRQQNKLSTASFLHLFLLAFFFPLLKLFFLVLSLFRKLPRPLVLSLGLARFTWCPVSVGIIRCLSESSSCTQHSTCTPTVCCGVCTLMPQQIQK